jgi:ABC-type glycerol-3-phosphate transport system permease component
MLSNFVKRKPNLQYRQVLKRILLALAFVIGGFLFLIYIMPFLWILLISFKPLALIKVPPRESLLFTPTFDNYIRLHTQWGFFNNVRNSLIISGGTTLLNLAVGLFAAFALVRYRLKGGNFVAIWILSQRFLPVVAILLPMFIFYQRLNLENTYQGLIIANTVATLPFTIWLLRGFLAELPTELYDAAEVDGCGEWGVMRRIVFPLSRPALGVTGVFSFLFSWNEFMIPLTLARPETATVTLGFAAFRQQFRTDWGAAAAATIVTIIPLYIVIALLQENIIRGLSMGAVKG